MEVANDMLLPPTVRPYDTLQKRPIDLLRVALTFNLRQKSLD